MRTKALRSEERLVEVSPHGDGLPHTQAVPANTSNPKKQRFYFKVHSHNEDVALMETGSENNTITEDADWQRTDMDGDAIKVGFEESSAGKCFDWPEAPGKTALEKQEIFDGLMVDAQRVQELATDAFKVDCSKLTTSDGFLDRFQFDSRGYATKILLGFTCCEFIGKNGAREATETQETAVNTNSDGDLMNIADLTVGDGIAALRGFEFNVPNVNEIKIIWTQETIPAESDTAASVRWGGAAQEVLGAEDNWREYQGLVRAKDLKSQAIECPYGQILVQWVLRKRSKEEGGRTVKQWRIEFSCRPIGNQIVMLGDGATCAWVGDPHFTTFDQKKHDPMSPTPGFYWIVKSSVVAVQAYYQGIRNANDPMRTRLVAFGGKILLGHTLIVGKDVAHAWNEGNPMIMTHGSTYINNKVWWDKNPEAVPLCINGDDTRGGACDLAEVTKTGSQTAVRLPLDITFTQTDNTDWCDQVLTMKKMPDWELGQCGDYATVELVDTPTNDNKDTAGCCQISSANENMFLSDYKGSGSGADAAKAADDMKKCEEDVPRYTLAVTNCQTRFGTVITDHTMRIFYQDCLLDLCNTADTPGGELIAGDASAGLQVLLDMDLKDARQYSVSANAVDPVNVVEATCTSLADCEYAGCGSAAATAEGWTHMCGAEAQGTAAPGKCLLSMLKGACDDRTCNYAGTSGDFSTHPGSWCCNGLFYKPCIPGVAPQHGCPEGQDPASVRSEGENRQILEVSADANQLAGQDFVALGAHSKIHGGTLKWVWKDGDEVRKTCDLCESFAPNKQTPAKAGLTLCWNLKASHLGKWEACPEGVPVHVACSESKMYGKMRGADKHTARGACGENKQMAQPKTQQEFNFLSQLFGAWAPKDKVWIGAHYANSLQKWLWEDGYPVEPNFYMQDTAVWENGQKFPANGGNYLCLDTGGKFTTNCGADDVELDVLCEIKGADRKCLRSTQDMSFTTMKMEPSPWYKATYRDHCFYAALPAIAGAEVDGSSCTTFCDSKIPGTGICDEMGLRKAASSVLACESVAASLGIDITGSNPIPQAAQSQNENLGCTITWAETNGQKTAMIVVYTPFEGDGADLCSGYSVTSSHHRICACIPKAELSEVPIGSTFMPGWKYHSVAINTEDVAGTLLQTQNMVTKHTGVSVMKVMAAGGVPDSDIALRLEINWDDEEVTRDCKIGGVSQGSMKTSSFPFWQLSKGTTYSLDVDVQRESQGTTMFTIWADGVHQPALDMETICGLGEGEVQFENMPATDYMLPPVQLFPSTPRSMSSANGCQSDPFAFHEEKITWYMKITPTMVDGQRCIRCEFEDFEKGSNIYIKDGKIEVTIKGSQPYRQQFPGYTVPVGVETTLAISYVKADKVIELYIDGARLEILYYNTASDYKAQSGQIGCYDTDFHVFVGEIQVFHSLPDVHNPRPIFAMCNTYPCEDFNDITRNIFLKNKVNSAHIHCDQEVCQHRHRMHCCDKLPMCNDAVTPLVCQATDTVQSVFRHNAGEIPCDDATCAETPKEKCCVPYKSCSLLPCPPQKMHRDNIATLFCNDINCTGSQDEDICCEPVQRCRNFDCGQNRVWKPDALNLVCSDKVCDGADDQDQCCALIGNCEAMTCPVNHNKKENAQARKCADVDCTNTNWEVCCAPKNTCGGGLTCPPHKVKVHSAEHVPCANTVCTLADDEGRCCVEKAPCSTMLCDFGFEQAWDASNKTCAGRVCLSGEDHEHCCAARHHCDTFPEANCGISMVLRPNPHEIMCESLDCEDTAPTTCCAMKDMCDSYPCLPTYVHLPTAPGQPCGNSAENRTACNDDDLLVCCERAASCNKHTCDLDHTKNLDEDSLFCKKKHCDALDEGTCCSKKGVCSNYNCSTGFSLRHNAHQILCKTETCDGTDSTHCCAPVGKCTTHPCPDGYRHKDDAKNLKCLGYECTETDTKQCCTRTQTCEEFANLGGCPVRYLARRDAGFIFCEHQFCSHVDLHSCCEMAGHCINYTCTDNRVHIPDAREELCFDRDCSPAKTPEETCCVEPNRCTSYHCPTGYVHKKNASEEFCGGIVCNDYDLQQCCDEVAMCTDLGSAKCPYGYTLNANHADIMCKGTKCSANDQDICCVPKGHCFSMPCPTDYLHRQDKNLLCEDENCTATENSECCELKNSCATLQCPKFYLHVDDARERMCSGFMCGPEDKSICCEIVPSCAGFLCPGGTALVHNAATLLCAEEKCTDQDKLQCCTGVGRCNSYVCPDGYQHRHNAAELYCEDASCTQQSWKECCVLDGLCTSYKCPAEDFVLKLAASSTYCETWYCTEENNDTERCCDDRAPCKDEICPSEHVLTWEAATVLCANRTCTPGAPDNETCCTQVGMCNEKPCPADTKHRHDAEDVPCSDQSCDETDYNTCCGAEDSCHTYNCPEVYVHKWDADNRSCQGFVCDETDTEHCCNHRGFCNFYGCDFGYTLKNESHITLCKNFSCTEEDLHTCCDHVGDCSLHDCEGEAWVHKPNASTIQCEDKLCLKTNIETCCQPASTCQASFVCSDQGDFVDKPPVTGQTLFCSDHSCSGGVTECCDAVAMCNEYILPPGYMHRHGEENITCLSSICNDWDLHRCAAEPGFCSSYECPHLWQVKLDAHKIPCDDLDCNATRIEKCCAPDGACLTYNCSAGLVHMANVIDDSGAARMCANVTCAKEMGDDAHCCEVEATCLSFCCNTRTSDGACPGDLDITATFSKRPNAEAIFCEALTCDPEDHNECCKEDGKCSSMSCGFGMLPRHNVSVITCVDMDCLESEANKLKCCVEEDDCPSYQCPVHMLHKNDSEVTKCREKPCSDADRFVCCDSRQTCEDFACVGLHEDSHMKHESYCAGRACQTHDVLTCCQLKKIEATGGSNSSSNSSSGSSSSSTTSLTDANGDTITTSTMVASVQSGSQDDAATTTTALDETGIEGRSCRLSAHLVFITLFLLAAGHT